MSEVKLEFPVVVQQIEIDGQLNYHLQPIFLPNTLVTNRRYDTAFSTIGEVVARRLNGMQVNRSNMEYLLWHTFNPDLNFYTQHINLKVQRNVFDGAVAIASFVVKGMTFICLPSFDHYLFIAKTGRQSKEAINKLIKKTIKQLLLNEQEANELIDYSTYYVEPTAFVTTVRKNVRVKSGPFHFEQEAFPFFFDAQGPSGDFEGSVEIEKVGKDLTELYPNKMLRAFYQEHLVQRLTATIYKSEHTPIVLVGKEGVGKHSLIHEVVYQYIQSNKKIKREEQAKIWQIDPTRIISGMSYIGWWQKRFEAILDFVQKRQNDKKKPADKIVFDNVVALLRIGKSAGSNMSLSDVLKPYIEKRQIQVVLIATPEEWKIVQEKDRRFSDLFQVLRIEEPDREEAVKMVLAQRQLLEIEYGCEITIQAIHRLFTIQRNYLKNSALPGSVIKLLRQVVVKYRYSFIDLPEVREEFQNFSGLEEAIFDPTLTFKKDQVRQHIGAQLVGQPEAVDALANVVHTIKAKLNNPNKPIASFLFIGPTGVGKTQAAKVLSNYLMGNEKSLIRFDMNEYIDGGAVHRLIGDYDNPEGQLTGKVRYNPFGILLLDEIEKAHPSVHDLLLQVLDDGRLSDSVGRTVYFTNLIIIMTSNVGAEEVASQPGFGQRTTSDAAIFRKAVENKFRPEFVNRIDQIVIFQPLALDHILNIARLQIKELLQRDGFVRRSTILNISQEALEWVAQRGFNERMGGRALKRQIEKDLTSLSAEQLISSYSEQPILFDIDYDGIRLIPKINLLEFVAPLEEGWLPSLPEERHGRRFYGDLIKRLERIEKQSNREQSDEGIIVVGDEKDTLNWQHYHFTNRIAEVKERLKLMMAGYRDRYFTEAPAIPLRLKRIRNTYSMGVRTDKAIKEMAKDHFFQQEAIQELTEDASYAPPIFDNMGTEFIDNFLNVIILEGAAKRFLRKESDQILIRIQTAVAGLGKEEIALLHQQYIKVFETLDIPFQATATSAVIELEGYGLYDLLKNEAGIHLFYGLQQAMIPIKITVEKKGDKSRSKTNLKIIRVYNGGNTLIDLRSGFSNIMPITANEFKLLLYAGMLTAKK